MKKGEMCIIVDGPDAGSWGKLIVQDEARATLLSPDGRTLVEYLNAVEPVGTSFLHDLFMTDLPAGTCPACLQVVASEQRAIRYKGVSGLYVCPHCSAVLGQCYASLLRAVVDLDRWQSVDYGEDGDVSYFDVYEMSAGGVKRIHGWVHNSTRALVQLG